MTEPLQVDAAIQIAVDYGYIDGAHHKQWVIDQMLRYLLGPAAYEGFVSIDMEGEWDTGVAP